MIPALALALAATLASPAGPPPADTLGGPVLAASAWAEAGAPAPALPALPAASAAAGDTVPRAIELSDAYFTRLTIHRYGSYAMLPLFGVQYALGQRLIDPGADPSWVRSSHSVVAGAVGALFVANTVTGAWNLWEARRDPAGRTRRTLHSLAMLAADAGFVATGVTAESDPDLHRSLAIGSMGLSAAGALMMYLWKD